MKSTMDEGPITLEYTTVFADPQSASGFVRGVLRFFGLVGDSAAEGFTVIDAGNRLLEILLTVWQIYAVIALLVSAALLYGILYTRARIGEIGARVHAELDAAEEAFRRMYGGNQRNGRFTSIEQHASSDNPSDWRLAIIEADIVLEELLDQRGFRGATIGERLKNTSSEQFHALDDAWKAHKVRNEIAHRGGDFILTKRTAQETIARYQHAFDELSHGAVKQGGHH